MNKQCMKCGFINDGGCNYCTKCGAELTQVVVQQPIVQNMNSQVIIPQQTDDSKGNILGILSLILYFGGSILTSILAYILPNSISSYISSIGGLLPLAGIVVMIIGLIALSFLLIILLTVFCFITCSTMNTSGCN